jgi:hypothetical protein
LQVVHGLAGDLGIADISGFYGQLADGALEPGRAN